MESLNTSDTVFDYISDKIREHFGTPSLNVTPETRTSNEGFENSRIIFEKSMPELDIEEMSRIQPILFFRNEKPTIPSGSIFCVHLKSTARLNNIDLDSLVRKMHNIIVGSCNCIFEKFQQVDPSITSCSVFSTNPDAEVRPFCSFWVKNPLYVIAAGENQKVDHSIINFVIFPATRTIESNVLFKGKNMTKRKKYSLEYDDTFRVSEKINSILNRIEEDRLKFYNDISDSGLKTMETMGKVTRMHFPRMIMRDFLFGNIVENTWLEMHSQSGVEYAILVFEKKFTLFRRNITVVNRISDSNILTLSTQYIEDIKKIQERATEIEWDYYRMNSVIRDKMIELIRGEKFEEENRRLNDFLRPRVKLFLRNEIKKIRFRGNLGIVNIWSDLKEFAEMYEMPFFSFRPHADFFGTNGEGIFDIEVSIGFEKPTFSMSLDFFVNKENQIGVRRIVSDSLFETHYRKNEEISVSAFCKKHGYSPREFLEKFKREYGMTTAFLFLSFFSKNKENENIKIIANEMYMKIKTICRKCDELRVLYDEYNEKVRLAKRMLHPKKSQHVILERVCGDKTVKECGSIREFIMVCNYYLGTGISLEKLYDIFPGRIEG